MVWPVVGDAIGHLVASITGGLIGLSAVVTAFAGGLTDPPQRAFGLRRRGVELKGGRQAFQVRDPYAARILDLVDLARMAIKLPRDAHRRWSR